MKYPGIAYIGARATEIVNKTYIYIYILVNLYQFAGGKSTTSPPPPRTPAILHALLIVFSVRTTLNTTN